MNAVQWVALFTCVAMSSTWAGFKIASPDKKIVADVAVTGSGQLVYSVSADGAQLLDASALGVWIDGKDLGTQAVLKKTGRVRRISDAYAVLGNQQKVRSVAREAVLDFSSQGFDYSVVVRVANDGVAVRYLLPENGQAVTGESTTWSFPSTARKLVWAELSQCYEAYSHYTGFDGLPKDKPFLGPLTVEVENYYLAISEADNQAFPDMGYVKVGDRAIQARMPWQKSWKVKPDWSREPRVMFDGSYLKRAATPWRYTIVGRSLNDVVTSHMQMTLCPEPKEDFAWVKPGRCLWQWWSVDAPKYPEQKAWFDAAAKLKWEYYLIDDGWRNWKAEGKDQWELLKEVIAYGKTVGVKSIVWVNSNEMRDAKSRRAYLEKVASLGASGIKIDFIPDCTQEIQQWYMGSIQDCADLKLLVNFHGSVKPTGLRRTFPHDITREAVRGNEWQMTRYKRIMPPEQYTLMPFSRMLAGAGDITHTMMDPKELITAHYTWPNQLAQLIVYLSPVTHFCDQYAFYVDHPAKDLLEVVPTVWEETRVLRGPERGVVRAFARRKGKTWWVGVINGKDNRELTLNLHAFLTKQATATLVYDAAGKDDAIDRVATTLKPSDTLVLKLRPAGGFFARFEQ